MASLTRRLSLTIFLAVLASLIVFAIAVSAAWWWNAESRDESFARLLAGDLAAEILPAADAGPEELQRALLRWHRRTRADLSLVDRDGRLIAFAGRPLLREGPRGPGPRRPRPWLIDVDLPDGRTLLVRPDRSRMGPPVPVIGLPLALVLLLAAVALVAWPVSRRITRRLETLQHGVEQQGAGDLAARVPVQGRDEVAALAESFNRSATRIQELVQRQDALLASQKTLLASQKTLLANASHELRSPLARIRMAIELMAERSQAHAPLVAEVRRNIGELDELVEEILLASRLETTTALRAEVDLVGLAAEEASRVGAEVEVADGSTPPVSGDVRLLRRMLRNLLENAARYHRPADSGPADGARIDGARIDGARIDGEAVRVVIGSDARWVQVAVLDRGPGVPADARERIFEAFFRVEGHSEQAGGVGLGLALVRQIAQAHGGDVRCEGRDGAGSRFVVRLPLPG